MKKHELLIPVGDMDCLKQAIFHGADAVYGACQDFGARKFAKNFSRDEMIEAIELCHLYDVKFYATMNTLVKNNEVDSFLEQIEFLYQHGVDAVIMQDFGMISYVLEKYPNLEVHASTQFNNSSRETVELLYRMGVKRVVLSRELSLEEIQYISTPIEKEVFIHGALCVSYSGCCLMSSMIGGRSGNRGECAGSCRLPYRLFHQNEMLSDYQYLLSMKELNTSSRFSELLDSDIYSFKVEGRMKSPEYVGFITQMYRKLIDQHDFSNLDQDEQKLKTIFNREFTCGHLFGYDGRGLINAKSPNHIGLSIGKVSSCQADKIGILLDKPLYQGDGIRFLESGKGMIVNFLYDKQGKLVSNVRAKELCYVDNKVGLTSKDSVHKTSDFLLSSEFSQLPVRKIPVTFQVSAHIGEKFKVTISDGADSFCEEGSEIVPAEHSPVLEEHIRRQLGKLGNTPFVSQKIEVSSDKNIFISLREINEIRRNLVSKLIQCRKSPRYQLVIRQVSFPLVSISFQPGRSAFVYTEEQMKLCLEHDFSLVYTSNYSLYQKFKNNDSVYYALPRCLFEFTPHLEERMLVRDTFDVSSYQAIGDYTLNVFNIYTAYYLYRLGFLKVTLSVELSLEEIRQFVTLFQKTFGVFPNVEVVGYGRVEDMIIKGNILDLEEDQYTYYLEDLRKRQFPVYYHDGKTMVLNYQKQDMHVISTLEDIVCIRYQFFDETKEEILSIL